MVILVAVVIIFFISWAPFHLQRLGYVYFKAGACLTHGFHMAFTRLSYAFHTALSWLSRGFHMVFTRLLHDFNTASSSPWRNFHMTFTFSFYIVHVALIWLFFEFHIAVTRLSHCSNRVFNHFSHCLLGFTFLHWAYTWRFHDDFHVWFENGFQIL